MNITPSDASRSHLLVLNDDLCARREPLPAHAMPTVPMLFSPADRGRGKMSDSARADPLQ
jgi:hypothetical protein